MAKDPAVLFYTQDFLVGTYGYSHEDVGKYIILLCLQHQHGDRLPKPMIENIIGPKEEGHVVWSKFKKDKDGFYYNERMREEAQKRRSYCKSRRKNRSKKHKKNTSKTHEKHMSSHMENENENANTNANAVEKEKEKPAISKECFDKIWNKYPRKKGKKAARRHFKASVKTEKDWKGINKALDNYNTAIENNNTEMQYVQHGGTWFNNWKDWLDVTPEELGKPKPQSAAYKRLKERGVI